MTMPRAFLILLIAFLWLIAWTAIGSVIAAPPDPNHYADIVFPIALGGFAIGMLAGFGVWAGAKGYPPWIGVLFAWLGPIGMIILVLLSDRSQDRAELASGDDASTEN